MTVSVDVNAALVFEAMGYGKAPVCIAKTQYSFSTNPDLKGAPENHTIAVREVRLSAGAEFVVVICGEIMTMPGLPKVPSANKIDLDDQGKAPLTAGETYQLWTQTTDDIDVPESREADAPYFWSQPGFDQRFGYGRPNANRAVAVPFTRSITASTAAMTATTITMATSSSTSVNPFADSPLVKTVSFRAAAPHAPRPGSAGRLAPGPDVPGGHAAPR